jgi:hypothetical protein
MLQPHPCTLHPCIKKIVFIHFLEFFIIRYIHRYMIPCFHLSSRLKTDVCYAAAVMPSRREAVQLCLLLLCVPVQYLLSRNLGTERALALPQVKHLQDVWFTLQSWNVKWLQFVSWMLRGKISSVFLILLSPSLCMLSEIRVGTVELLVFSIDHVNE